MKTFFGEIRLFLSSRWRIVLFLVLPPLITVYYGLVFHDGIIEHTRLVIVDRDQTSLSRSLVGQFRDNKGFHVVAYADNVDTAFSLVNQEKADMVLAVPPHFGSDIKAGKSPELLIAANAANMAISSNGMKRAGEIILTFNGGIALKKLEGLGFTSREAEKIIQPLGFHYRQVGNPSGTFYDFLVWGLIGAIGHFPIMLFSATAFNRKKEMVTMRTFVARFCVYTLFGVGQLLMSIFIGVVFFPMTFSGGIIPIVLLVSLFTMAVTALGMLLSLIIPDRAIVVQAATIVALPALILSGYTWPMSGFPGFVRVLGYLEPLTYFANPLRRLALTGLVDDVYRFNCVILLLIFLLFFGAAFLVLGKGKVVHRWNKKSFSH
ncbi:MAG: ABC transporter permease [Dehalobacterium sp.]|jgi:ABC-2 type transport system permease protein